LLNLVNLVLLLVPTALRFCKTTAEVEDVDTLEEDEYDESDEESFEILPENSWMTADFSDNNIPESNIDPEAVKVKVPPPIMETEAPKVWDPSRPERRRQLTEQEDGG
jgi:hypothetical protein